METENAPKFSRFQLFKTKIFFLSRSCVSSLISRQKNVQISKVYTLQDPNVLKLNSKFKIHSVR